MRMNILYLFYIIATSFILFSLAMELSGALTKSQSAEPQYVFTAKTKHNTEKQKQKDFDIIYQWAQDPDAANVE
ncbi:hypothetical protein MACH09_40200 [Vibrio sp. MACH09]|uniref:hypothetical protein n=1 Tax=Vibrio sp. MACH09 TaxID=3025122 RepID=UPI00278E521F|nr:hypothetical protein [Vibrio sp. MACH09]GLO63512.1 hypothetical protein MACH09_40200 [Vibrio sp. MACH09]